VIEGPGPGSPCDTILTVAGLGAGGG
jgi:hypothetical protein